MQPCWQVFPKEKDSSFTTKVGPNKLGKKVGGPVYGACVIRIYTERSMVTRNEILAKKLSHLSARYIKKQYFGGNSVAFPFFPVLFSAVTLMYGRCVSKRESRSPGVAIIKQT